MSFSKIRHIIIHSSCDVDIETAKREKLWASTIAGNETLTEFYEDSIVFLYFTKFETNKFIGVARMKSLPNIKPVKGLWAKEGYGMNFKIEWFNSTKSVEIPTPYRDKNVLDTTEMDEKTGKLLLDQFINDKIAKNVILAKYLNKNTMFSFFPKK